jgi:phytoene desaturase
MKKNAIVIGAGIGGLATAVRLAVKGYSVEVFESSEHPGGKLSEIKSEGFRFDAGPSLFTLPNLVDELFTLAGKNPSDYIAYSKLDIICKYFYEDGTILNAYQDVDKLAEEFSLKTDENKQNVLRFLNKSKTLYNLTANVFIFRSFQKLGTYLSWDFIKAAFFIWKLNVLTSMHGVISKYFSDNRIIQLFNRYATYNGSDPYVAPGTLNVIPHLEHSIGAFFPEKGMYAITQALHLLAKELGVNFHFKKPVKKILLNNKNVEGIETTDGLRFYSNTIVSDVDVVYTYKMLEGIELNKKYLNHERSTSALIFYWGINKSFPELELHNIFFSEDYKTEFDYLFNKKLITNDPTVYVFISSKKVKDDAPQGKENWFTMINVPENIGQDWDELIATARKHILEKLRKNLNENIENYIETEKILEPRTIESKTSSYHGSLYGNSSNSMFSAFSRHPNSSRKIKGLYFVGGSVHPGGGIPLCLSSARIVDSLISPA